MKKKSITRLRKKQETILRRIRTVNNRIVKIQETAQYKVHQLQIELHNLSNDADRVHEALYASPSGD